MEIIRLFLKLKEYDPSKEDDRSNRSKTYSYNDEGKCDVNIEIDEALTIFQVGISNVSIKRIR